MKSLKFLVIAVLIAFAACQSNKNTYEISGSIAGLDSGEVYLVKAEAGQPLVLDTAIIEAGNFVFTGTQTAPVLPEVHYLRINQRDYFAQFFLENTNINVEAYKDSLDKTVVSGSEVTEVFNVYVEELNKLNKKYQEYQQAYSQARMKGDHDEMDRVVIDLEATSDNMKIYAKNYVRDNASTVVAPYIVLSQLLNKLPYTELKELADLFPVEIHESIYVTELNKILVSMAKTAEGAVAPEFTVNDPEGNPIALSSFRGKYLLIDFWASWCGPCRAENPNVLKVYGEYKDKNFEVLGVSLDKTKEPWLKAVEADKLTWSQGADHKGEVANMYGVKSIPHTLLLDPEGKIIAKNLRGKALEEKLAELLN